MAFGQIFLRVDAAHESVEIFDLPFWWYALLCSRSAAHHLGFVESLELFIDLVRQAAVRRDLGAVTVGVDMPLKGGRALCIRNQHRLCPVRILVGGEADGVVGIATTQEINLVEFEL